jgi:hypothetical protein
VFFQITDGAFQIVVAENKGEGDVVDRIGLRDAQQRFPQLGGIFPFRVVAHQHHKVRLEFPHRRVLQAEEVLRLFLIVVAADGPLVRVAHQHDPEMMVVKS